MAINHVHHITPQRAADLLHELGYKGKVLDHEGMLHIETAACGVVIKILFWDPHPKDKDQPYGSFQFLAEWRPEKASDTVFTRHRCNLFNENMRFCKASIIGEDENGVISLRHDVLEPDGLSDRTFNSNFENFITQLQVFIDEVIRAVDTRAYTNYEKYHRALTRHYGIEADIDEAVDLYWEAATGGFAAAQNNLGDLYETGTGVEPNESFALYWYTRASERGEPTAYAGLAMLLAKQTDDRDILIEASKYAILAAEKLPDGTNKSLTEQFLVHLHRKLSEDDIQRAKDLAAAWTPLFQEPMLQSDTMNFTNANSEAKPVLQ